MKEVPGKQTRINNKQRNTQINKSYWESPISLFAKSAILRKCNAFSWDPFIRIIILVKFSAYVDIYYCKLRIIWDIRTTVHKKLDWSVIMCRMQSNYHTQGHLKTTMRQVKITTNNNENNEHVIDIDWQKYLTADTNLSAHSKLWTVKFPEFVRFSRAMSVVFWYFESKSKIKTC